MLCLQGIFYSRLSPVKNCGFDIDIFINFIILYLVLFLRLHCPITEDTVGASYATYYSDNDKFKDMNLNLQLRMQKKYIPLL